MVPLFHGRDRNRRRDFLLVPATTAYAAAYLTLVCVGALIAQAFVLHGDVIHAIVLAVISGSSLGKAVTRCVVLLWHASTLADKPPDHRQCLFDAQAAFGDRFISRVEFHEADVTQTRSEHDVRRLPRQCARDVVLHNVDRVCEHIEVAQTGRFMLTWRDSCRLLAQRGN